jgi:hypothetical protein
VLQINWIKTETLWKNIIATGKIETKELIGFDFILCDEDIKDLNKYLSNWIVPIIPLENPFSSILQEFNPMRNEWNAYIFNKEDKRSIFYAIVRYIENSKFPFDNKNLVKNVLDV